MKREPASKVIKETAVHSTAREDETTMMHCRWAPYAVACLLGLSSVRPGWALTNSLALTPPMGWNSWYVFLGNIDEGKIRSMADAMSTNGMKDAGYQFICIDDGWAVGRDTNGLMVADASTFPSGIPALADYVHSKGLKFGIYTDHGTTTCMGRPGSYGYEYLDANTYAAWGVDFVKEDNCNLPAGDNAQLDYASMSEALRRSGRPIVFNICAWAYHAYDPDLSHMWRTTGDTSDNWSSISSKFAPNGAPAYVAGPGRWNDPDILQVGLGGMSLTEDQAHFSLWCLWAAPLVAGNDLTTMSPQTKSILLNPEVIAVDQEPAGEQGIRVASSPVTGGTLEVWSKPLGSDFNTRAVLLLNNSTQALASISATWTNLGLQAGPAMVRDLWARADLGMFTNRFTTNVPSHGVVMLKVAGSAPALPALGTNYLSDLQPVYAYTGWGTLVKDKSIVSNGLSLNGTIYGKGLGAHALSGIEYRLGGTASRFQADIGVDDEVGAKGSVVFQVFADGTRIYDSGVLRGGMAHQSVDLDVTGVNRLSLGVGDADDGINYDHADWAAARILVTNLTPAAPPVPTGLSAVAGEQIALSWNAGRSAISWNIKRSTHSAGPFSLLGTSPVPSYSDADVLAGTTYFYKVSAAGKFGESGDSTPVSASPCSAPGAPSGVVCTASNGAVVLRWNAVLGATSYTVSRALSSTPYSLLSVGLTNASFTDSNVNASTHYYYVVQAANGCRLGPPSAFASSPVPPLSPALPIFWAAPVTISTDTDVSTNGALVAAYSFYNGGVTLNGVSFTSSSNSTALGSNVVLSPAGKTYGSFGGGSSSPFAALSANYKTLLSNGRYYGTASPFLITLTNLTSGHRYQVQLWCNDSRSPVSGAGGSGVITAGNQVNGGSNTVQVFINSTGAQGGVGQYSLGSFAATATNWTFFTATGTNYVYKDTYINAIQLRDLGVVATTTPPALMGWGPWSGGALPLVFSGPSNQTYRLLSSTNVTLPLNGWTVLSTGAFHGNPISYLDSGATNSQQFYRLASP
jgi:alpha-galactosidase